MEDESGPTPSIIDELLSGNIQGHQKEGESVVTHSIIDELHSWDIQGHQMEVESMVLPEISLMNLFLRISKEIE